MPHKKVEDQRKASREWKKNNPERVLEYNQRWKRNNPTKVRASYSRWKASRPWEAHFYRARWRCNELGPSRREYIYYRGKGIRMLLTMEETEILYKRDHADQMKCPSIDRINSNGDYHFGNCRFIELLENLEKARKLRWEKRNY